MSVLAVFSGKTLGDELLGLIPVAGISVGSERHHVQGTSSWNCAGACKSDSLKWFIRGYGFNAEHASRIFGYESVRRATRAIILFKLRPYGEL